MNKYVQLVFSLLTSQKTTIGALTLDALLEETNSYSADVTEYPVEFGAPVSDNIGRKSEKLMIRGVVTGAGVSLFGAGGKIKMIAAKEAIAAIEEQQVPITVVTGMDIYEDYALESCTVTRGNALEKLDVSMTLKKIRYATPKATDMPPEKVSDKPSSKGGKAPKGKAGKTRENAGKAKVTPVDNNDKQMRSGLHRALGRDATAGAPPTTAPR